MHHDYYYYNKEQLLENPKIPMVVMEDKPTVFKAIAREMADFIKAQNEQGKTTVFICPVGPIGQYPYFVDMVNEENINLNNCWFINMDEYLDDNKQWIDINHPLSFRGFMNRTVYSKIKPELNVPEDHRVFPDPNNVEYIPNLIERLGGVDICFGGIGINGHLAFNEADGTKTCEEFKALKTRVLPISPETRAANAIGDFGGRLEDMPVWCVTIGFNEIYNARKIRLGIFRDWHRAVARRCGYGEMTADFPVSMVAEHPDALIRMTEFVANLED
ncbi:MAG: glucosamine-6-phosphate isomerase [Oscillospiraceae bacterium]|nr:glucosamine-6-phosphate isomerase [Oscillospiraceae bacterium]